MTPTTIVCDEIGAMARFGDRVLILETGETGYIAILKPGKVQIRDTHPALEDWEWAHWVDQGGFLILRRPEERGPGLFDQRRED